MKKLYLYKTRVGPFYIAHDGKRFFAMFKDEELGGYESPEQASEDLAGGHCFSSDAGDTAVLGIPEDLSEWNKLS
jgi:hypothetical protein